LHAQLVGRLYLSTERLARSLTESQSPAAIGTGPRWRSAPPPARFSAAGARCSTSAGSEPRTCPIAGVVDQLLVRSAGRPHLDQGAELRRCRNPSPDILGVKADHVRRRLHEGVAQSLLLPVPCLRTLKVHLRRRHEWP
jgi:hypothetical protein